MIRRRRFGEVIERQFALFSEEHDDLLAACGEALRRYDTAGRDEAGEHYERFGDLQEEVNEELEDLRDRYAAALDDRLADRYVAEFDRAAAKRFRGIWL
jgi:hypothetical protein